MHRVPLLFEIDTHVSAPGLGPDQGRAADERCGEEHVLDNTAVREVPGRRGFDRHLHEAVYGNKRTFQPRLVTEDPGALPHRKLELFSDIGRVCRSAHEFVELLLLLLDLRLVNLLFPARLFCRGLAGPFPEDLRVGKGVPAEPVCTLHAARRFPAGKETGERCPALGRYPQAAHYVVGGRGDLHGFGPDVHTIGEELFEHHRKSGLDLFFGQMGHIEVHAAPLCSPALRDFRCNRPGDHVPGRKLHPVRVVVLHEPFPEPVFQDTTLATDGLGDEPPPGIVRVHCPGRVELDHLHIDELRSRPVSHGKPVAGPARRVRGNIIDLRPAAGRNDRAVGRDRDQLTFLVKGDGT